MIQSILKYFQLREARKDLSLIHKLENHITLNILLLSDNLCKEFLSDTSINLKELLYTKKYDFLKDPNLPNVALQFGKNIRTPFLISQGDSIKNELYYLSSSLILHSLRAIYYVESTGDKRLLNYCRIMWNKVTDDTAKIPPYFR